MPEFYMIFARKIYKIPEFYVIFVRKMPEVYKIIAREIFFFRILGGHVAPHPLPHVSYAYEQKHKILSTNTNSGE